MIEIQTSESVQQRMEFARGYLARVKKYVDALSLEQVAKVMDCLERAYRDEAQVFIIGNGGSAATASHMACDLAKNVLPRERGACSRSFRVLALTDNVSWTTALANDLGYEHIFSEQLRSIVREGDWVIAISGSGNSPNVVEGVRMAKALGAKTLGILGFDGGSVKELVDVYVLVEDFNYECVEDVHVILSHLITSYLRRTIGLGA